MLIIFHNVTGEYPVIMLNKIDSWITYVAYVVQFDQGNLEYT